MQWITINRLVSTLFFYFGWVYCLYEASKGRCVYSFLLIVSFIMYSLYYSSCRKADVILLLLVLSVGPLSDILYSQLGLLEYQTPCLMTPWIPPLWVYALWGLFGANIHLFAWLYQRWYPAVLFGAVGGPLSYLSVFKLGGASLLKPLPIVLITIGGIWAIYFPLFIWLNSYLREKFKSPEKS